MRLSRPHSAGLLNLDHSTHHLRHNTQPSGSSGSGSGSGRGSSGSGGRGISGGAHGISFRGAHGSKGLYGTRSPRAATASTWTQSPAAASLQKGFSGFSKGFSVPGLNEDKGGKDGDVHVHNNGDGDGDGNGGGGNGNVTDRHDRMDSGHMYMDISESERGRDRAPSTLSVEDQVRYNPLNTLYTRYVLYPLYMTMEDQVRAHVIHPLYTFVHAPVYMHLCTTRDTCIYTLTHPIYA